MLCNLRSESLIPRWISCLSAFHSCTLMSVLMNTSNRVRQISRACILSSSRIKTCLKTNSICWEHKQVLNNPFTFTKHRSLSVSNGAMICTSSRFINSRCTVWKYCNILQCFRYSAFSHLTRIVHHNMKILSSFTHCPNLYYYFFFWNTQGEN